MCLPGSGGTDGYPGRITFWKDIMMVDKADPGHVQSWMAQEKTLLLILLLTGKKSELPQVSVQRVASNS